MLTDNMGAAHSDQCALSGKRRQRAEYMREYGRRHGAEPVKGLIFICEACSAPTPKTGHSQRWCSGCKPAGLAAHKRAKRAEAGTVSIGSQLACKNCQIGFVKIHKRQFYCGPCMNLAANEALPAYRKRVSKYQVARNKRRRSTDPAYAINCRMSAGINGSLKSGKGGKSWQSLVDYTVSQLCSHLERQFLAGMTWENRALWHIDHRVPLSSFKFEAPDDPEFHAAWSLTNLQPLWSGENIRKSGKRIFLL